jgi:hypothetical protein
MNPEIWGPHAWFLLHTISFNYPENPTPVDKNNIRNFIYSFGEVIPCDACKIHFKQNLKNVPLTEEALESNNNLVIWFIDLHNVVNKMNGKKILTQEDVMEYYKKKYENNEHKNTTKKKKTHNFNKILIIMIIIIFLYIYRKKIFNLII